MGLLRKLIDKQRKLYHEPGSKLHKIWPLLDAGDTFLVRAIQANDLEEAINLGLLEVTEEDVALCTFADPCKMEIGDIIRSGLDMYEKEG